MASRKVTLFMEQPPGVVRRAVAEVAEAWFAPAGFLEDADVAASDREKGEGGQSVVKYTLPAGVDDDRAAALDAEIHSTASRLLDAALNG